MLSLVVSVCLLSSPSTCEERYIPVYDKSVGLLSCVLNGQQQIAEWHLSHTEWEVKGWKCEQS